jgi:hypothetical protein
MRTLSERDQITSYPETTLRDHLLRYYDLFFEDEMGPIFVIVEMGDKITGPNYAFIGNRGLLSDLFEEHEPGHPEFARPYEWASHIRELHIYEVLLLINNEDGYLILIPENVVEAHPDLKWILTAKEQGGLSDPQPLH